MRAARSVVLGSSGAVDGMPHSAAAAATESNQIVSPGLSACVTTSGI
jgi:hypothetical protein